MTHITVQEDLLVEAVFDFELPDTLVHIPAGTFTMGNDKYHGQKPARDVHISAYYVDQYEVTKSLWYNVHNWAIQNGYKFSFSRTEANGRNRPHADPSYRDDFPISGISWQEYGQMDQRPF